MTEKKPTLLQQAVRQAPWRAQTPTTAILALVVVVTVIIGALYLAQATTTATTGRALEYLESTRDFLQRANEETSAEIASKIHSVAPPGGTAGGTAVAPPAAAEPDAEPVALGRQPLAAWRRRAAGE